MVTKKSLRAVIFKRGEWWVGQCLEHDIGAQARTLKQIAYELERALVAHIIVAEENSLEPFESIGPAPQWYWKMFEDGWELKPMDPIVFEVHGRRHEAPAPEVRMSELMAASA